MAREESYYDQTRQSDTLDAWDELRRRNELPTEGPVHQFDRRGVRTVNEDLYGGGPQAFDPRMALELIRNPEGIVQHLASLGHSPPPKDFEEGEVTPRDAHMSLGKHLASAEFAGGKAPNWFPELDTELGRSEPEPAGLPQQEAPTPGRYGEPSGLPGQYDPTSGHPIPPPPDRMGQGGAPYVPPPGDAAPRQIGPPAMSYQMPAEWNVEAPGFVQPWSRPRESNEAYEVPTPAPEAPNTGAAPAPSTSPIPRESGISREPAPNAGTEQFGEESSKTPEGLVTSREPGKPVSGKEASKGPQKEEPLDSFARALMGLKAPQYQNPIHITSPQAPRPTNLLARSTVPQTLMQEISALGHPAASFRLGEALRGK